MEGAARVRQRARGAGALLPEGPLVWLDKLLRDLRFGLRSLCAEPRLCDHRDSDAGAWHRREHSGLQRDERGAAALAAGARPVSPGVFADLQSAARERAPLTPRRPSPTPSTMRCGAEARPSRR